eukprot:725194-Pleurochrysis_carterae.AAC.2
MALRQGHPHEQSLLTAKFHAQNPRGLGQRPICTKCGIRQACSASSFGNLGNATLVLSAHDPSSQRGDYNYYC